MWHHLHNDVNKWFVETERFCHVSHNHWPNVHCFVTSVSRLTSDWVKMATSLKNGTASHHARYFRPTIPMGACDAWPRPPWCGFVLSTVFFAFWLVIQSTEVRGHPNMMSTRSGRGRDQAQVDSSGWGSFIWTSTRKIRAYWCHCGFVSCIKLASFVPEFRLS